MRGFIVSLFFILLLTGFGSNDNLKDSDLYSSLRIDMVERQIISRGVSDPQVLEAMKSVPRHLFVPPEDRQMAYEDHPLPIGFGQTISQPYIVAFMTELMQIEKGDKVLEIGTGSGYQAAVLSALTDDVYTIEIVNELAESADNRLKSLGYNSIEVKNDDGYYGWSEKAPFDKIIVTAAAGHVPPELIKQLSPGGMIVIPIGKQFSVQYLTIISKDTSGTLSAERILPVRFVPFVGQAQK